MTIKDFMVKKETKVINYDYRKTMFATTLKIIKKGGVHMIYSHPP
ncbi:TPA: hypothetical protein ACL2BG_001452 [Streptococcus pneumoniae]|nr:Uncharacterised protein [Streptococcus pneumoniae]VPB74170.1 Uncharacterised protein [Streptococcus pneumoniae]